jgi:hypothetical protein
MSGVGVAAMVIVVSGFLVMGLLALALHFQARARRVFYRCSAAAQAAGVEEEFMAKFNSIASYGDSLDSIILRWGARRIKRMYDEVAPQ